MFWTNGYIYLLTKHRSDSSTKLYRIDASINQLEVAAEFVEQFNIQARVTGADIDSTGNNLVVLTETSIWLFEKNADSQKFFGGKKQWLPLNIPQAEAVSFDGSTILILNEYGKLFEITSTDFYMIDD